MRGGRREVGEVDVQEREVEEAPVEGDEHTELPEIGRKLLQVVLLHEGARRAAPVHRHDGDDPFVRTERGRLDIEKPGRAREGRVQTPVLGWRQPSTEEAGVLLGESPLAPLHVPCDPFALSGEVAHPRELRPIPYAATPQGRFGGPAHAFDMQERRPQHGLATNAGVYGFHSYRSRLRTSGGGG